MHTLLRRDPWFLHRLPIRILAAHRVLPEELQYRGDHDEEDKKDEDACEGILTHGRIITQMPDE